MKTAHQYMIALTPVERTPSVKAMVDIILLDAEKEMKELECKGFWRGAGEGLEDEDLEGLA